MKLLCKHAPGWNGISCENVTIKRATYRSRHTQSVLLRLGLTTAELKLSNVMGPVKSAAARPPHILDQSTDPVPRYPLWLSPTWKYLSSKMCLTL